MPAGRPPNFIDQTAERWHSLAVRRHAYYLELLQSGRWRRYFNEEQFAERLRDVIAATRAWSGLSSTGDAAERGETRSAA